MEENWRKGLLKLYSVIAGFKLSLVIFSIMNAKYKIPDTDLTHQMFHDLIKQTLVADPALRPTVQQMLEHLGEVAVISDWDLEAKIDFERAHIDDEPLFDASPSGQPPKTTEFVNNHPQQGQQSNRYPSPKVDRPGSAEQQQQQQPQQQQQHHGGSLQQQKPGYSGGLFNSMKGAGSQMLGKVSRNYWKLFNVHVNMLAV